MSIFFQALPTQKPEEPSLNFIAQRSVTGKEAVMSTRSTSREVIKIVSKDSRRGAKRRGAGRAVVEALEARRLLTVSAITITPTPATEGVQTFTVVVSASTDHPLSGWTIDWGDGRGPQPGGTQNPATLGYAFPDERTFNIIATATDDTGSSLSGTASAIVSDGSLAAVAAFTLTATEGQDMNTVVLGAFTDSGGGPPPTYSLSSIDWGDTTTSGGTIGPESPFPISGDHTYKEDGTYQGTAHVLDDGGATVDVPFEVDVADQQGTTTPTPYICPCKDGVVEGAAPSVQAASSSPESGGFGSGGAAGGSAGPGLRSALPFEAGGPSAPGGNISNATLDNPYEDEGEYAVPMGMSSWLPRMFWANNSALVGISTGGSALWFDANHSMAEYFGYGDTLTADSGNRQYVLQTPNGTRIDFYDSSWGSREGLIKGASDAAGNAWTFDYASLPAAQYQLSDMVRSNTTGTVTVKEMFGFSYVTSGVNKGILNEILLERKTFDTSLGQNDGNTAYSNVSESDYASYGSGDSNGPQGYLQKATDKDGSGNTLDVYFYRHWTGQTLGGVVQPAGALKYLVMNESYARLAASLSRDPSDPLVDDSAIAPYADRYYEYNSAGFPAKAVQQGDGCSVCSGGQGSFTFAYASNPSAPTTPDYNIWTQKVTETMPDLSVQYHYSNGYSQEMLSVIADGHGNLVGSYTQFNTSGQPILIAQPSAVAIPSLTTIEGHNDLMNGGSYLNPHSGLITTIDYYNVGWQFTGLAGVSSNGSSISGTLTAPEGTQAAFLTGGGTMTQVVSNWAAGSYTLSFKAARPTGSGQTFEILLDGTPLTVSGSSIITPGAAYGLITTDSFTVAAGTHTIEFEGLGSGSDTALIDQAAISGTSAQLADGGFEIPSLSSATVSYDPLGSTGTATTAGGVTGYLEDSSIQDGTSGTPIHQEHKQYYTLSGGGIVISPVASDTMYGNADGTDARETQYSYTLYSGTAAIKLETTTLPAISSTTQNGSGTSDTMGVFFNTYGQPIWTIDQAKHVTETAYDIGTGGVLKTVEDVNYASLSSAEQTSFNLTGWTQPTGGLQLVTTMQVDPLGRETEGTSPNGNVTFTVYRDQYHEVRVYPGWNSTSHTTTGPIEVSRGYWPAANAPTGQQTEYSESLTSSATPGYDGTTGNPNGSETIDQTNIQSLSRQLTNGGGQVIEDDAYFSMSGITYSQAVAQLGTSSNDSSTGNYDATLLGYDHAGRPNRTVSPTGTIQRTVYDVLGHVVSKWEGTNDTPTSGYWSPTNTAGSNMVQVEEFAYDAQAAPAGPGLSIGTGGTLSAGMYYVKVTYIINGVETAASAEADRYVNASGTLTVTSPAAVTGATGYNIYVAAGSGGEVLQNGGTPISIGTNYTLSSLVTGTAQPPQSGVGDGNLTRDVLHTGISQYGTVDRAPDRETDTLFDWRDRAVVSKGGVQAVEDTTTNRPIVYLTYDNLDEVTQEDVYLGDTLQLSSLGYSSGVPNAPSASLRRAESTASFDDLGREFDSKVFSVDQTYGTVGSGIDTSTFYDPRGYTAAVYVTAGGATKYVNDGAGRLTKTSITDGGAAAGATMNLTNAMSVASDIVLEQTLGTFDGDSNLIFSVFKQRFDNDPTTSSGYGDLGGPGSGSVAARDYYAASYYDATDRMTDNVNVGTNGGSAYSRPSSVPSRSGTVLLTHTDFDVAGNAYLVTDPRGIANKSLFDMLGRTTSTIADYTDGTPTANSNQTTAWTYNGDSEILTMKAVMPSGQNSQETKYVYGTGVTPGTDLFCNNLVATTEFPDPTTGLPGTAGSDEIAQQYDWQGDVYYTLYQSGDSHVFAHDALGRETADSVLALGSASGPELRQGYTYNIFSLLSTGTTYSNYGGTIVMSQVEDAYNGFGQLTAQYQEHNGAVNTLS